MAQHEPWPRCTHCVGTRAHTCSTTYARSAVEEVGVERRVAKVPGAGGDYKLELSLKLEFLQFKFRAKFLYATYFSVFKDLCRYTLGIALAT